MSTATTSRFHLRAGLVITLVASFLTMLVPAPADAAVDGNAEAQFVSLLNQERAARGLPKLVVASDLVAVARQHSAQMAANNDLYHNPNLGSDVTGWQKVGENVGRGPSVSSIHDAFMASAGHRANILDPEWTEVGVGVEVVDGRVWVTEIFRLPLQSSSVSEPAPVEEEEPAPAPVTEDTKDDRTSSGDPANHDHDAPAAAPSAAASAEQQGQGSAEGSGGPAPLPALSDRTLAVLTMVESVEDSAGT